ncbi:MAG: hypothetical protein HY553_09080 [Elusimicrobia bacterium]|nr:hypothetical protein [Elusimicrobiota bacterium]
MPLSKETARQLVKLQEQDKVIDALQADIDKIPKAIAEIQARIEARKSRLHDTKKRAGDIQIRRKEKEAQMAAKEADIKKRSGELNTVKTNEAFRAIQSEIEQAKAAVGDLETAILTLMDEADQVAKDEKGISAELKVEEGKDLEEIGAFENDKKGLESKQAAEKAKRDALVPSIPEDVLKHYEHLRKRKAGGAALAPVLKNMCGGCRIALPPQVVVEVVKASKLQTCEACHRILYMPDAAAPTPAS